MVRNTTSMMSVNVAIKNRETGRVHSQALPPIMPSDGRPRPRRMTHVAIGGAIDSSQPHTSYQRHQTRMLRIATIEFSTPSAQRCHELCDFANTCHHADSHKPPPTVVARDHAYDDLKCSHLHHSDVRKPESHAPATPQEDTSG